MDLFRCDSYMLTLTYQFQLQPNRQQEEEMSSWLETARKVYNYALAEKKDRLKYSCSVEL